MKYSFNKLILSFFIVFISLISAQTNAQSLEDELKKSLAELIVKGGFEAYIRNTKACENNIINYCSYSCYINKQKETNQAYLEIEVSEAAFTSPWHKIPKLVLMPDVNIKVSFENNNKIYTHDLTKRDWKMDGTCHLYWDINYKDVDISKPIKVTFTGTANDNLSNTQEISINDYYNSDSWFTPSGRGADVKAYGKVKGKGIFSSWF